MNPRPQEGEELVLGVSRARILGDDGWLGIRSVDVARYLEIIAADGGYRARDEAEEDPSWKQVIPYLLLRDGPRVFLMRRTRAGTDARLHERWSIGIGGHLNPDDGDPISGLRREFEEEMLADWHPEPRLIGLLNDDRTPVGAVHLGLVFSAEANGRAVRIRETDKLAGAFATLDDVRDGYDHLESWSQIVFDFIASAGGSMER